MTKAKAIELFGADAASGPWPFKITHTNADSLLIAQYGRIMSAL